MAGNYNSSLEKFQFLLDNDISNDLAVDLFLNEKISFIQFYLFYFRYFRQILKQVKIKKFYHLKIMKLI